MRNFLIITALTFVILLLGACQTSPSLTTSQPESQQTLAITVQTPETGKATLVGKIVHKGSGEPVANIPVRLADVYRQGGEGAYVLDGAFSRGDITDENGEYLIENVDVKDYVIIVGDVMKEYEVVTKEDGRPRVWSLIPNEVFEVPTLEVNLTSP